MNIKSIFCFHRYEWEIDINGDEIKVCRKCNKVMSL